jgi:hypothetical protein
MTNILRTNTGAGPTNPMALSTRLYIGAVIAAGAAVLGTFAPRELSQPLLALTFLAAMTVVSLFKLRLPLGDGHSTMSMAYVVDFAVIATAGADLAMVIAAAGVIVQCTVNVRRRQPWYRTAFSVATVVLAVRTAGLVWAAFGGGSEAASGFAAVVPLIAAAVPYFAINTGLVAAAIALSNGTSPMRTWQQSFLATAPSVFAAAGVVAAIEIVMTRDAYTLLVATAVPMALCHLAYAAWFRRLAPSTPATA